MLEQQYQVEKSIFVKNRGAHFTLKISTNHRFVSDALRTNQILRIFLYVVYITLDGIIYALPLYQQTGANFPCAASEHVFLGQASISIYSRKNKKIDINIADTMYDPSDFLNELELLSTGGHCLHGWFGGKIGNVPRFVTG